MAISGLRHSGNFAADQRPKSWRETILLLRPNGMAPITGLTSKMKKSSVTDPEFSWFEKVQPTQRMQIAADIDATQVIITVTADALQLKMGSVIRVESTDELLFVSADPSSDTSITVTRGFAGTTAAAVVVATANPFMHMIGSAYEEGSEAPSGVNYDPAKRYNYLQIFRDTLELTRTASKTRLRTGDQVKEAKRECLEAHSVGMEKAFIFGKRFEGTRNGKPFRTTGGITSFIDAANIVTHATGNVTLADLEGYLERIFRYGASEKMAFCGNTAVLAIQRALRKNSQYQLLQGQKEFGMNVQRLVSPFGELVLKTHPLFNQLTTTSGATWAAVDTWMMVLDFEQIGYRHMEGDDTRYEKDLQENGVDGMKSGYISECGLEVSFPQTHFLVKGMKAGAVDA